MITQCCRHVPSFGIISYHPSFTDGTPPWLPLTAFGAQEEVQELKQGQFEFRPFEPPLMLHFRAMSGSRSYSTLIQRLVPRMPLPHLSPLICYGEGHQWSEWEVDECVYTDDPLVGLDGDAMTVSIRPFTCDNSPTMPLLCGFGTRHMGTRMLLHRHAWRTYIQI
jgi:hypothetical protein